MIRSCCSRKHNLLTTCFFIASIHYHLLPNFNPIYHTRKAAVLNITTYIISIWCETTMSRWYFFSFSVDSWLGTLVIVYSAWCQPRPNLLHGLYFLNFLLNLTILRRKLSLGITIYLSISGLCIITMMFPPIRPVLSRSLTYRRCSFTLVLDLNLISNLCPILFFFSISTMFDDYPLLSLHYNVNSSLITPFIELTRGLFEALDVLKVAVRLEFTSAQLKATSYPRPNPFRFNHSWVSSLTIALM